MAGRHLLFNKPVTPEPLMKPTREGQRIDKAGDNIDAVANVDEGTPSAAVAAE
jgi:CPA2 family monovalent cation:H+ antiporter-2